VVSVGSSLKRTLGYGWRGLAMRLGGLAVVGLVVCLINTASEQTDIVRRHLTIAPLEPLVWELTSWVAVMLTAPLLLSAEAAVAARGPWLVRAVVVLACGLGFNVAHVAAMTGLRDLIYASAHARYQFGPVWLGLLYEGRKDLLSFSAAVALFWLWRQAFETPKVAAILQPAPANTADLAFVAEGRQGRVVLRAPEIDWVEAQGNYVALHARGQSYLIRLPLKAVDEKLRGAAFVRSHRSALVNMRRVRAIHESGDGLKVELANDELAPLSGRHKAAVVKALAAG
jgi:hypothetical protein